MRKIPNTPPEEKTVHRQVESTEREIDRSDVPYGDASRGTPSAFGTSPKFDRSPVEFGGGWVGVGMIERKKHRVARSEYKKDARQINPGILFDKRWNRSLLIILF